MIFSLQIACSPEEPALQEVVGDYWLISVGVEDYLNHVYQYQRKGQEHNARNLIKKSQTHLQRLCLMSLVGRVGTMNVYIVAS